jgi:DNA-binding winged helix-turn-helix (wHTH) protein
MDVQATPGSFSLLTTAELAARQDFELGEALVSPSTRVIQGPGGEADIEPRVMQALVALWESAGAVVTREMLFDRCWGNAYVGDDSLNRAIAGVRRVAKGVAAGSFEIETVPRTGYRLIVKRGVRPAAAGRGELSTTLAGHRTMRRALVTGMVAVSAVAGIGSWIWLRDRPDPRFQALMARGEEILLKGSPYEPDVIALYEGAVRFEPGSAKAWGLLAYHASAEVEHAGTENSDRLIAKAEDAIRRALAIDPREPNALTALYLLKGPMLDWVARDRHLRDILAIDANSIPALGLLMGLLQSAGLTRESWDLNERILELAPFSRNHLVFRAMKLWILGRVADSDKVIDRVRGLWPLYEFGFGVRLMLFALTGRPKAALAMLESIPERDGSPVNTALWRPALAAFDSGASVDIEAARTACVLAARATPQSANMGVMILCALGLVDDAFEIADGYLLWRGKVVSANRSERRITDDINRRMPPWLFTPPVAVMRTDPRFARLCADLGLTAYWRARGVKPDYLLT